MGVNNRRYHSRLFIKHSFVSVHIYEDLGWDLYLLRDIPRQTFVGQTKALALNGTNYHCFSMTIVFIS